MKNYKHKKVWLNTKRTKYCIVKLFADKKEMQQFYYEYCIKRGNPDTDHFKTLGVSLNYSWEKGNKVSPETGTILLCFKHCGVGVATHEFMHAILWAHKHKFGKRQYPIIINSMKEEEMILHNFTFAIVQFYNWYWKIEKQFKKV